MSRENFLLTLRQLKEQEPVVLDDLTSTQVQALTTPKPQRQQYIGTICLQEQMSAAIPNMVLPTNATSKFVRANMSMFRVMAALSKQLTGMPLSETDARRYFAERLGDRWERVRTAEVWFWGDHDSAKGVRLRNASQAEYLAHVQTPEYGISMPALTALSAIFGVNFILTSLNTGDGEVEYVCLDRGTENDVYAVLTFDLTSFLFQLYQRDLPQDVNEMPLRVFTLHTLPALVRLKYTDNCPQVPAPLAVL